MTLHVTKITSIGAVTDGDNPESKILLFKSREPDPDRAIIKEPKVAEPTIEELQALIVEKDAEIAKLSTPEDVDPIADADPVLKARFDAQQAEIAEIRKQADDAAEALAKERDERADVEVAEFTKTHAVTLGDDAAEMIKSLHGTPAYGWLGEKLATVEAVLKASDLLKELGVVDDTDPASQIQTLAVEKMKDNDKLTIEQSRLLVRKERPDLAEAEREAN